jgi:hypothetical protein
MSSSGLNFYPQTIYFNNINFNNDFYAIPNNNQGISLAYANTHFLFSTGVANSTATSTFFSGSVGVGAIATGLAGDMNALKYLLNGNNISNIFVSSNVLSNTSNTLNTKIDTKEITNIINNKKYIDLGTKPGILKRHLLFYSLIDDNYFVIIQDIIDGGVLTVLTEEYQNNLAMKIKEEDKQKAKELILLPPSPTSTHLISAIFLNENKDIKTKELFKIKDIDVSTITEEYFINRFIDSGIIKKALIEKGIDLRSIDGYSIKKRNILVMYIDYKHTVSNIVFKGGLTWDQLKMRR